MLLREEIAILSGSQRCLTGTSVEQEGAELSGGSQQARGISCGVRHGVCF